jgi:hypothetical protein
MYYSACHNYSILLKGEYKMKDIAVFSGGALAAIYIGINTITNVILAAAALALLLLILR